MNKEYQSYLRSDDWKEKKAKKYKSMAKKKRKCCACGCIEKRPLHVHHLNYKNLVDVENADLRILCERCHTLAHILHKIGKIKFINNNPRSRWYRIRKAVTREINQGEPEYLLKHYKSLLKK